MTSSNPAPYTSPKSCPKPDTSVLSPDITNSLLKFAENMNNSLQQENHKSPQRPAVQQQQSRAPPAQQQQGRVAPPVQQQQQSRVAPASSPQHIGSPVQQTRVTAVQQPVRPTQQSQQFVMSPQQSQQLVMSPRQSQQLAMSPQQSRVGQQQQQSMPEFSKVTGCSTADIPCLHLFASSAS